MSRPLGLWPPPHFCSAELHPGLPCGRCCIGSCHGVHCERSALQRRVFNGIVHDPDEPLRDHRPEFLEPRPLDPRASTDCPATLMRFLSSSAPAGCAALSGAASPGRSRFDVTSGRDRPSGGRESRANRRPCGFSPSSRFCESRSPRIMHRRLDLWRRCSALRDFTNTHNLAAACRRSSAPEVWPFAVLLLPAGESDVDRCVFRR
jgi:hypothetical protein